MIFEGKESHSIEYSVDRVAIKLRLPLGMGAAYVWCYTAAAITGRSKWRAIGDLPSALR